MDEQTRTDLINQLYFSREAAQYLNVTMERLEELVRGGRLRPIKRSTAENLFLRDDLDACRTSRPKPKRKPIYKEDMDLKQPHLQKAVNYFTLRYFCQDSNQAAEPVFISIAAAVDLTLPIEEIGAALAKDLKVSEEVLLMRGKQIRQSFKTLERDDLVIGRDEEEYPLSMRDPKFAPPYLFLRGDAGLLKEKIIAIREVKHPEKENSERAIRLAGALENAGAVIAVSGQSEAERAVLKSGCRPILAIDTPLPDQRMQDQDELLEEIAERGLIVSMLPPSTGETAQNDPAAAERILHSISLAAAELSSGRTDMDIVKAVQQKLNRVEEIEKNRRRISQGAGIFSKGIRADYVYHTK